MLVHLHSGLADTVPQLLYSGMFFVFVASVCWRPAAGLYYLVLALPLQTGRYKIHELFLGSQFVDILLLGVILGLLFKGQTVIPRSSLSRFFLIFAGFYYLSLWQGAFFLDMPLPLWISDARFSDWKNYVEMFLLALVVSSTIKSKRQVQIILAVMCLSVLIVNRSYLSILSGRDLSQFSENSRDAGPLGYAGVNGFAAFEAMFCSLLLGLYVSTKKIILKAGIMGLMASSVYCLLFAFSRGGYIGMLAGLVAVGILRARYLLVIALLLVIGWQAVLPDSVQQRIAMTTESSASGGQLDSSSEERLSLWQDAVTIFKGNPVTGTGFQTYQYMGRVGPYRDTHNYYMKILAETGIVGMVLYLLLLLKLFAAGKKLFNSAPDPFWSAIGLGFVALMSAAIVLNFFGDRWTYQQVDGYLWVTLGCVLSGLNALSTKQNDVDATDESSFTEQKVAALAL